MFTSGTDASNKLWIDEAKEKGIICVKGEYVLHND